MYKLCFYVPESHLDAVKSALFEQGAGHYQNYDRCCWQVLGEGQFRPLAGSDPWLGVVNSVEKVAEYRVEMICREELLDVAVAALKSAHPYEEPAFDVIQLVSTG